MDEFQLLDHLNLYVRFEDDEKEMRDQMIEFIKTDPNCFENTNPHGHITASAWIYDSETQMLGLVHHKKFNKWLQTGGHSDGNPDTASQALREAQEEFGHDGLVLSSEYIFDVDVHQVPADLKRDVPPHLHYDVRFLIYGNSSIPPHVSDESHEARWVALDEVEQLNNERSMMRMVEKTRAL